MELEVDLIAAEGRNLAPPDEVTWFGEIALEAAHGDSYIHTLICHAFGCTPFDLNQYAITIKSLLG